MGTGFPPPALLLPPSAEQCCSANGQQLLGDVWHFVKAYCGYSALVIKVNGAIHLQLQHGSLRDQPES